MLKNKFQISNFGFQISNFRFQILEKSAFICVHLWLVSLGFFAFPKSADAQVRPVYDYGAIGLGQLLKRLNNTKSVMHIGAHPDDEDSGLLAYLARGENARTAYLSLTRGDGGQNIIGAELSESLGVIRTEELLQARRLDGAEQFFTRAFDYGFSKTLDEAKAKWDERIVLCDAVRAIRTFRPLVVISRFSGTPADGHGHHQYAGYIAPLAVKAAHDANQCKDAGAPWQVLKFYVSQGFRSVEKPTLSINTGQYDPLLGRSYFEIAMEGRSQHKTQEQGVLELKGERFSGLNLIESAVPKVENERSVFDGIDTSLAGIPKTYLKKEKSLDEFTKNQLIITQQSAELALKELEANNPQKMIPVLTEGLKAATQINLDNAISSTTTKTTEIYNEPDFGKVVFIKVREFTEAIRLASGLGIDALSNKETVAPGENFLATVKVFLPNPETVKIKDIALNAPTGWTVSKVEEPKDANQNPLRREIANSSTFFDVKVVETATPTEPYFLKNDRKDYLYPLEKNANPISPFQSPLVWANVKVEINGVEISFNQRVEYRFADDVRGEVRRDLNVVPTVSVSLDQKLLIVPSSNKTQTRHLVMSVTNFSEKPLEGEANLSLGLFGNWQSAPSSQVFNLKKKGEKAAIPFDFTIPANTKPGNYTILPTVAFPVSVYSDEMTTLAYQHIQTHRFYSQISAKVCVLDLKVAPVKIGYIMGSGDAVPEAIRQMNLTVEMLDENDLTSGDLAKYGVIVVGIRAFQVRQDLISNNERVLDYVKNGGVLIVQYQRPEYESLLPFPAKLGARVADENAKITMLEAVHPAFNFPNVIAAADFEGWVQERNLYAFTGTFDANYKSLLEAHDAGEAENRGGLVIADIGKGKYVYCSYAFFRQLPAGVPGAYRLFANLLSLK